MASDVEKERKQSGKAPLPAMGSDVRRTYLAIRIQRMASLQNFSLPRYSFVTDTSVFCLPQHEGTRRLSTCPRPLRSWSCPNLRRGHDAHKP